MINLQIRNLLNWPIRHSDHSMRGDRIMKRIARNFIFAGLVLGHASVAAAEEKILTFGRTDRCAGWSVIQDSSDPAPRCHACLKSCDEKHDPEECMKNGGSQINCYATYDQCKLDCTRNCK